MNVAWLVVAFLSGSIPFGWIIARWRGVDIRAHGSGNIGATNVARVLGRGAGLACFGLDAAKGLAPTLAFGVVSGTLGRAGVGASVAWWWLGVAACAIAGHMFTPWVGFRGGKGVATGLGALLGIFPYTTVPAVAALVVWIVVVRLTRYVGLASCIAALCLPGALLAWDAARDVGGWGTLGPFVIGLSALAVVVIVKHRGNLARTLAGTERKFGQRVHVDPDSKRDT